MKKLLLLPVLILSFYPVFSQPEIIAHRGASYLAPENTVSAAKLAWELGTDAVEIDIHFSKDGQIMVNHDKDTKRTAGENYVIKETDAAVLRKLDLGKWKDEKYTGEKMPFLAEVIETVPEGKILVVEIKCTSEVLPALKEVVGDSGKKDQIIFIAFDWQTILDTKTQFPGNECYWLSSTKAGLPGKMKEAVELGLDGVNLQSKVIDSKTMELANELGIKKMLCWTVDDPAEAKRLAELGVKGITTNRPAWLKEQLGL
jgi:glycerophosphoryl diester phosphodiesterase